MFLLDISLKMSFQSTLEKRWNLVKRFQKNMPCTIFQKSSIPVEKKVCRGRVFSMVKQLKLFLLAYKTILDMVIFVQNIFNLILILT